MHLQTTIHCTSFVGRYVSEERIAIIIDYKGVALTQFAQKYHGCLVNKHPNSASRADTWRGIVGVILKS
jgi:hypothetical protein